MVVVRARWKLVQKKRERGEENIFRSFRKRMFKKIKSRPLSFKGFADPMNQKKALVHSSDRFHFLAFFTLRKKLVYQVKVKAIPENGASLASPPKSASWL